MKKQITLSNGKVVNINPNLNAFVLFQLQGEGVINSDFLSSLLSTGGNIQNINIFDGIRTVYAAYRQATPTQYMDFESFMKLYEVDMVEVLTIFTEVMRKEKKNNGMANGFHKKTRGKKR
ncbi:hypothetical protein P4V88_05845 [Bacillus thuringiensis]|uniref:hypothetical protein n=1 Tax=Bacillus thuringiensis TaxID=1428 RepID=UPI000A371337|nr:hypothetical protein [Bacillus thuringiensis]MED2125448.1 hypothetical protein [Bacillus thuringiensis]MED2146800.1 hypothetical protein [Bacillus thuringiensis]MED2171500.1 hypothetical protein [Bacillus thuringiensis]MED2476191.1 hypothetical protein [Bacillus thuringiensis]MED2575294.1 hypothetical protein [Bacillus thuringiensis]